jgi:hypothetical protein
LKLSEEQKPSGRPDDTAIVAYLNDTPEPATAAAPSAIVVGVSLDPGDHPELSDEVITGLAAQRDDTRARTLAKIRDMRAGRPS